MAGCVLFTGLQAALAQEAPVYSNAMKIEDVATLARVILDFEDEELPEGAVWVAAVFEPGDLTPPEVLTVIAIGSGLPEKVLLTAENHYRAAAAFAPSVIPLRFMIVEPFAYTIASDSAHVLFTVDLAAWYEAMEEETPYRNVTITSNMAGVEKFYIGFPVQFTSNLEGYEGLDYTLQWQRNTGAGWENIPGENGETYAFIMDTINYWWYFRLVAAIIE
jgi:hypothetical protein